MLLFVAAAVVPAFVSDGRDLKKGPREEGEGGAGEMGKEGVQLDAVGASAL